MGLQTTKWGPWYYHPISIVQIRKTRYIEVVFQSNVAGRVPHDMPFLTPLTSDLCIPGGGEFGIFRSCLPDTLISLLPPTFTPWWWVWPTSSLTLITFLGFQVLLVLWASIWSLHHPPNCALPLPIYLWRSNVIRVQVIFPWGTKHYFNVAKHCVTTSLAHGYLQGDVTQLHRPQCVCVCVSKVRSQNVNNLNPWVSGFLLKKKTVTFLYNFCYIRYLVLVK